MKIIFLDIDGVLNSDGFFRNKPPAERTFMPRNDDAEMFDPAAVKVLNEIIEKTGAKIVVSSSWRGFMPFDDLKNLLNNIVGVKGDIIDKTMLRFSYVPRGQEIRTFLAEYENDIRLGEIKEPIEGIVILDDDYTVGDQSYLKQFWIKTFWDDTQDNDCQGLVPKHVDEAMQKIALPFKLHLKKHEKHGDVSPEND